ncbi:6025_t:CDS:2 [Gigaspora margarita]|uniref:6025_t:CDS:1 n=1 Tax=Gigaspora margarita TaxID=4874 RepID=A0ABN7VEM4_GIGMA|nr:6025_t:CDS:2 [Gigaspora margarita]
MIEQLLNYDNTKVIQWKKIANNVQKVMKGKQPKWYEEIQKLIEETINQSWNLAERNPFTLKKIYTIQVTCKKIIRANLQSLKESRNYIEDKPELEKVGRMEKRQHKGLGEINEDQWYRLRRKTIGLKVLKIRICSSKIIIRGVSRPAIRATSEELDDTLEFTMTSFPSIMHASLAVIIYLNSIIDRNTQLSIRTNIKPLRSTLENAMEMEMILILAMQRIDYGQLLICIKSLWADKMKPLVITYGEREEIEKRHAMTIKLGIRADEIISSYYTVLYGKSAEDMVHVLSCRENKDTLEEVIKMAIKRTYKKTRPAEEQQRKFIEKYHEEHIQKKRPIRFISEATMGWKDPQSEKQSRVVRLHHEIVNGIYERIWKKS